MRYILYYRELYIVPEPLTKNRTAQSWRGKQIAMSNDRKALEEYASELFRAGTWYIEDRFLVQKNDRPGMSGQGKSVG